MKRFFIILFLLTISVGLGLLMAADSGYFLVAYQDWSIETSLWVGLGAWLLFTLVVHFLLKTIHYIKVSFLSKASPRKRKKGAKLTQQALTYLVEGNEQKAQKKLIKAASYLEYPFVNYFMANLIAEKQHDWDRCYEYLQKAEHNTFGNQKVLDLLKAQILIKQKEWRQAYNLLKNLNDNELAGSRTANLLLLKTASRINSNTLNEIWDSLSKTFKSDANFLKIYCEYAPASFLNEDIAFFIETALKKQWDSELLFYYTKINTPQLAKYLHHAEKWLKKYPEDAELLWALGQISTREKLWGKAEQYFSTSLAHKPQAKTYAALASIQEILGQKEKAFANYKKGLELAK